MYLHLIDTHYRSMHVDFNKFDEHAQQDQNDLFKISNSHSYNKDNSLQIQGFNQFKNKIINNIKHTHKYYLSDDSSIKPKPYLNNNDFSLTQLRTQANDKSRNKWKLAIMICII